MIDTILLGFILLGFILFSYCFNEPLVTWYGKAVRHLRKQAVGENLKSDLQPAPHPSQGSLRSRGLGGLLRDLHICLGPQVGYSWAKSLREWHMWMWKMSLLLSPYFFIPTIKCFHILTFLDFVFSNQENKLCTAVIQFLIQAFRESQKLPIHSLLFPNYRNQWITSLHLPCFIILILCLTSIWA